MAKVPVPKNQLREQLAELKDLKKQVRQAEASNPKTILPRSRNPREQKTINTRRVLH
jgi:hypothetical protein